MTTVCSRSERTTKREFNESSRAKYNGLVQNMRRALSAYQDLIAKTLAAKHELHAMGPIPDAHRGWFREFTRHSASRPSEAFAHVPGDIVEACR